MNKISLIVCWKELQYLSISDVFNPFRDLYTWFLLNYYFDCSFPDNYGVIKSLILMFFMQLKLFFSHVTFAKPKSSRNSSIGKAGKLFLDSFLKQILLVRLDFVGRIIKCTKIRGWSSNAHAVFHAPLNQLTICSSLNMNISDAASLHYCAFHSWIIIRESIWKKLPDMLENI